MANECTAEIALNGTRLINGDMDSCRIIFARLSGTDASAGIRVRARYIVLLERELSFTLREGDRIDLRNIDGPVVAHHVIGGDLLREARATQ